jgi:hypothetical protein
MGAPHGGGSVPYLPNHSIEVTQGGGSVPYLPNHSIEGTQGGG